MYAIVDIETTGAYAAHHRITEIAIYQHNGVEVTGQYTTLINPEREIPYYITGLTGISNDMLRQAPAFEEVAPNILHFLENRIFVAHNAHFDYSFIRKEFEQIGIVWQPQKLCTVRLSRKIIPGLRSYSLGSLTESLGIRIQNRHRAGGDAEATARVFGILLNRDTEGHIGKALKRSSGETTLPPNLSKAAFDQLPQKPGVYYFLNEHGQVIYVGKANNIKKRVSGHFTGEAREWSRARIRSEIHHITYELTGNELIALILESQEIRRLWPKYNQAQKYKGEAWGIFGYTDGNGYARFSVNTIVRGAKPLARFTSKGDAWNFLWEKVREFELCPKLSGLQLAKGLCFQHQTGECKGACQGIEPAPVYNERIERAVSSFKAEGDSVAIMGQGRHADEHSVVLVEKGNYLGYGFIEKDTAIHDFETARNFIRISKETPVVQNLINSFLVNPKGAEVIQFQNS
ncbi:MAG TPA: exonuclease domain-containing protein [Cyclobacteriaceae bacterium]|nr:exonuclease domain-containing protein [Cyclobacteriaceae bacterium]